MSRPRAPGLPAQDHGRKAAVTAPLTPEPAAQAGVTCQASRGLSTGPAVQWAVVTSSRSTGCLRASVLRTLSSVAVPWAGGCPAPHAPQAPPCPLPASQGVDNRVGAKTGEQQGG